MERYFSTGQSPEWAVVPMEDDDDDDNNNKFINVLCTSDFSL